MDHGKVDMVVEWNWKEIRIQRKNILNYYRINNMEIWVLQQSCYESVNDIDYDEHGWNRK